MRTIVVLLALFSGALATRAARSLLEFSVADRVFITGSAGDAEGNVYLCGYTDKPDSLPGPVRHVRAAAAGSYEVFVIKLGANGRPVATLVLGGSALEYYPVIAVNAQGQVAIAGITTSTNFPVKNPLVGVATNATGLFVCKFDSTLTNQLFGTCLGAGGSLAGVALDSTGNIFLAGSAYGSGSGTDLTGHSGPFVAKLAADGATVLFVRGAGTPSSSIRALAVDTDGNACVVGDLHEFDSPLSVLNAVQPLSPTSHYYSSFLARFDPNGELLNSTYLGGPCGETLVAVAFNSAKEIFVAGTTRSDRIAGVILSTNDCNSGDAFLLKLDSSATNVLLAKVLDHGVEERVTCLAVFPDGTALVGGLANGYSFGLSFLAQMNAAGEVSTHYPLRDCGRVTGVEGMTLGPSGSVVLHGQRATSVYYGGQHVSRVSAAELSHPPKPFVELMPPLRGAVVNDRRPPIIRALPGAFTKPVQFVSFYDGTNRLGSVTAPPYEFQLPPLRLGAHSLTAVARLGGLSVTSCAVPITARSPRNDDFNRRIKIIRLNRPVRGDTIGASAEPDEPLQEGPPSVWYSWRAPSNGVFAVSLVEQPAASYFSGVYASVFTGETLASLRMEANTSSGVPTFRAQRGSNYHIRVSSYGHTRFRLTLRPVMPPSNDDFARATPLTGAASASGTLHDATVEPGESTFGIRSVWYRWTTPTAGLFLAAVPYGLGNVLVFTGTNLTNLVAVGQHVYGLTNGPAFYAVANQDYFISVATHGSGTNFHLSICQQQPPVNDSFASRPVIPPVSLTVTGSCLGATTEPGEPLTYYSPGYTVWWRWVAPTSGLYRSSIFVPFATNVGSSDSIWLPGPQPFDAETVRLFTGTELENLQPLYGSYASPFTGALDWSLEQGVEYQIAVSSSAAQFTLQFSFVPPPPNDNFSAAEILNGFAPATGTTTGAGLEPGEPQHGYFNNSVSVWYRWTAPSNGLFKVECSAQSKVYFGETLDALAAVTTFGDLVFRAEAGVTYRIAVFNGGDFTLRVRAARSPSNDDFSRATPLTGADLVFTANPSEATVETGEPDYSDYEHPVNTVWYSWTAPTNGSYVLRATNDNSYGLRLTVYSGDVLTNLTQVDSAPWYRAADFRAEAGQEFFFSIDGSGYTLQFPIRLRFVPPPANDHFTNAIVLAGTNPSITVTNLGSTSEPDEPEHGYGPARHSIWYAWTAPLDGRASFILESDFTASLAFYTGDTLTSLVRVLPQQYTRSKFNLPVEAGVTYRLAADGYDGSTGGGTLRIYYSSAPVNDDFVNRLSATNGQGIGSTEGASRETLDPDLDFDPLGGSVWWTFTPQTSGVHRVSFGGSDSLYAGVYRGASLAALERISTPNFYSPVRFIAAAGEPVFIQLIAPQGSVPEYEFAVDYERPPTNDFFTNRITFTNSAHGTLQGATVEPGEVNHLDGSGASAWWSWTAPQTGLYEWPLVHPTYHYWIYGITVQLYTGTNLAQLQPLPRPGGRGFDPQRFEVVAGTTYVVSVDSVVLSDAEFLITPVINDTIVIPPQPNGLVEPSAFAPALKTLSLGRGVIETSTDLMDWQPWRTNQSAKPLSVPVGEDPQRFFRVR